MLKIIAKCEIKDSERTIFVQNATQLVNKSREDAGCISYELFHDLENKDIYFFVEEWKSDVHAKYHSETEHFKTYFGNIAKTLASEPEIHKTQKSL